MKRLSNTLASLALNVRTVSLNSIKIIYYFKKHYLQGVWAELGVEGGTYDRWCSLCHLNLCYRILTRWCSLCNLNLYYRILARIKPDGATYVMSRYLRQNREELRIIVKLYNPCLQHDRKQFTLFTLWLRLCALRFEGRCNITAVRVTST